MKDKVAAKWNPLGIQLNFSSAQLNKIEADVSGRNGVVEYCFPRILDAWITGKPENYNKERLIKAVKTTGFGRLATEIENEGMYAHDMMCFTSVPL